MSKKLYYSACSIAVPHIGVIIDDILTSKKSGDEVFWCYCHCALSSCFMNLNGAPTFCSFCHSMYRKYKKEYAKDINMLAIDREKFNHVEHQWQFENLDQVKKLKYRDVYVGDSILSLYFSITRDLDVVRFDEFKSYALPLVDEICDFVDYVYELIDRIKPDEIISYNGRLFENRLFYDISKILKIEYTALEVVGGIVEPYKKQTFKGDLPHSIVLNTRRIESLWSNSPLSDEQKNEIASSFYSRRRGGELVADVAVYTSSQKRGLLPSGFDQRKKNVAIFNSSQDEMAALGGEWEQGKLFSTQYEAIEYLLKHTDSSIHYYLRVHPNLRGVNHKEHLDLYKLKSYNNITIVPPESDVSTYALLDSCEKVITFGSTMGVEATFWGKPSILLGRSLYENLNACYTPKNVDELISLIEKDIPAKDRLGAIKYAYYLLDRQYKIDKNIIDVDVTYKKCRWVFRYASYLKICGSQLLYQLAYWFYCIILPKFCKGNGRFPY